jgi:hypothetical protein
LQPSLRLSVSIVRSIDEYKPPFPIPENGRQLFVGVHNGALSVAAICVNNLQIVRPLELIVETQPQLQPAALSLSAMISQLFIVPFTDDSTPFAVQVWSLQAARSLFGFAPPTRRGEQ